MRLRPRIVACAALVALVLAPASSVAAASHPRPRTSMGVVANHVMCVVCGIPLAIAQSAQADRERALITPLIAKGDTLAQIEGELVKQYGPAVIAQPPGHGFGLVAYLVPILLALLVAGALVLALRRWRARGAPAVPNGDVAAAAPLSPADAARLDADLERYPG